MAIHPLSVVDPQAEIHPDAIIGPFCVVKGRVSIGAGSELRSHACVYGRATIGQGCILFPGSVVGGDPQDLKFKGEDSEVIIGNHTKIHECATVNKGTESGGMKTVVGDHVLIMAYAHIAHDCVVEDRVVIANSAQLAGHCRIGRRAVIGGMVGLHHFVTVGELTIVGSMGGVRYDLPPFMMADGVPAEPRNVNVIGLRRDGWTEAQIERVRTAYRSIYRDPEGRPLAQCVTEFLDGLAEDPQDPAFRLATWIKEHLDASVKGRMLEAHRKPVVGGKPAEGGGNVG
jgi:UDP-N-acetylglucosamine acyltransferase